MEQYLDKKTFFDGFSIPEMLNLIRFSERCFFEAGTFLFNEGDESESFHIICNGEILVELSNEENEVIDLVKLGPGNIIGEIGFFDGKNRTASAKCLKYSGTLSLSRKKFQEIEETDPGFALKIVMELGKIVAERLRWCDRVIASSSMAIVSPEFLSAVENLEIEH